MTAMRDILGFGLSVGLLTAAWCLLTGGSIPFALLAYSLGGTSASMLAAFFVAMAPETGECSVLAD